MRGATHVVVFDAAGRNLLRTKLVGITEGFERPSRPLTMSRAALAAMMSILVLAAGCGMRGRQAAAPAVNQPRPHSTATLQILEPLPGSVITNTKLRVRLALVARRLGTAAGWGVVVGAGVLGIAVPVGPPGGKGGRAWWWGVTSVGVAAFAAARMLAVHTPAPGTWLALAATGVAAIAEEAFFRRFLYGWLARWGEGMAVAGAGAGLAAPPPNPRRTFPLSGRPSRGSHRRGLAATSSWWRICRCSMTTSGTTRRWGFPAATTAISLLPTTACMWARSWDTSRPSSSM